MERCPSEGAWLMAGKVTEVGRKSGQDPVKDNEVKAPDSKSLANHGLMDQERNLLFTRRRASHRRLVAVLMAALGVFIFATVALMVAWPHIVSGREISMVKGSSQPYRGASNTGGSRLSPKGTPLSGTPIPKRPRKLIMDVDAGADDAMGLLLVLAEEQRQRDAGAPSDEQLQLIAVTCTHGNTELENVEQNVLKTLHLAGRLDIPVFSGASKSLISTPPVDHFFGFDGFGDFEYKDAPDPKEYIQKEHAVNALVRLAREHPGEITLLGIGPLSNLGLAIRMDPNFLNNLQQIILMGGSTEGVGNAKPGTEFNFFVDPESDYIVFNSSIDENKPLFILPWESVAARNLLSMDWRKIELGNRNTKYMDFLNKAEHMVLNTTDELWISADPVATAILIHPELINATEQHHVEVELHGELGRGSLFVDYNDYTQPRNTVIVKSFDVDGYKNLLVENLG